MEGPKYSTCKCKEPLILEGAAVSGSAGSPGQDKRISGSNGSSSNSSSSSSDKMMAAMRRASSAMNYMSSSSMFTSDRDKDRDSRGEM